MSDINGVDVSDNNGKDIDWKSVKDAGYVWGYTKATEGIGVENVTLKANLDGMRANGMLAGAYHFLSWKTDPKGQADYFLSKYTPTNGDLSPMLDCEVVPKGMSSATCIAKISAFLQAVEPHLGGARMWLYMSYSFPGDHLDGGSGFAGHPLWVAAYDNPPSTTFDDVTPSAWKRGPGKLVAWQWTSKEPIHGIPKAGNDANRFNGSIGDLRSWRLRGLK